MSHQTTLALILSTLLVGGVACKSKDKSELRGAEDDSAGGSDPGCPLEDKSDCESPINISNYVGEGGPSNGAELTESEEESFLETASGDDDAADRYFDEEEAYYKSLDDGAGSESGSSDGLDLAGGTGTYRLLAQYDVLCYNQQYYTQRPVGIITTVRFTIGGHTQDSCTRAVRAIENDRQTAINRDGNLNDPRRWVPATRPPRAARPVSGGLGVVSPQLPLRMLPNTTVQGVRICPSPHTGYLVITNRTFSGNCQFVPAPPAASAPRPAVSRPAPRPPATVVRQPLPSVPRATSAASAGTGSRAGSGSRPSTVSGSGSSSGSGSPRPSAQPAPRNTPCSPFEIMSSTLEEAGSGSDPAIVDRNFCTGISGDVIACLNACNSGRDADGARGTMPWGTLCGHVRDKCCEEPTGSGTTAPFACARDAVKSFSGSGSDNGSASAAGNEGEVGSSEAVEE